MPHPPAPPEKRNRAAARRQRRNAQTPRATATTATAMPIPPPLTLLWAAATVLLLGLVAIGIGQKITWYLAVDQYGYLAFAHDLAKGRIFHDWPPLAAFTARLPPQVDVLSQTYVYDHGRLYCRYAPGFPILLAGWLLLFGDNGVHYLNPTIYVGLLVLLLAFQTRLFRSRWRALVGVALVILTPSMMYLWGTTLTRDLCAHLFGVLGVFLLLPNGRPLGSRRTLAAGLVLGYTASIRPDGIMYLVPAGLVCLLRFNRARALWRLAVPAIATGALGVLIGVTPFLAYNWIATGNPLRPTQGMELQNFLPGEDAPAAPPTTVPARVGYPPGAWVGGTYDAVQGGGLRLANLPRILPGNMALLQNAYSNVLLGVALLGALLALVQRRLLFCAVVPYTILAVLFYSCWSRPDGRYLSGVFCLMPVLMVEGIFGPLDLVRRLVRGRRVVDARCVAGVVAAALVVALVLVPWPHQPTNVLSTLVPLLCLGTATATVAAAVWPRRRLAGVAAPVLGLVLVGISAWRYPANAQTRAAFQQPQMLRARATFARAVEPNSVVITTEDIGRPGENIDYYSGVAHAFYITDLMRWRITLFGAVGQLYDAGMMPYLLLPSTQPGLPGILDILRSIYDVDLVAKIPARQAMDYFVAAPFRLPDEFELYRMKRKGAKKG